VEFALLAPLLLLIVVGVIQFGVGLNYWLDLQRIANQGARWAVVNAFPVTNCKRGDDPADCPAGALESYLASRPVSGGLDPNIEICFEEETGAPSGATVGDPVTVRLTTEFDLVPLIGFAQLDLKGEATMRIEQTPTRYDAPLCPA
jgi:TadE-like protein